MQHSKRYRTAREQSEALKTYPVDEAVKILSGFNKAKFNETVELSVNLGVDPKQSNQMVRGIVNLPKGSGKKVRVVVFTEQPEVAIAAGADEAGLQDLLKRVEEGWMDFDVAVATPTAMKEVRRVARTLGPRGLMPNPKSGTVTEDVAGAIHSIKMGGRVEFKMDKTANIGVVVGKRTHSPEDLAENIKATIDVIAKAKPENVKGRYIKSMTICSTMSPSVRLEPSIYAGI
ncbi:MAG: 50S ribosomal protein L1 [Opitutales bacterium]|jgi:large subunit ribosomal protein L1